MQLRSSDSAPTGKELPGVEKGMMVLAHAPVQPLEIVGVGLSSKHLTGFQGLHCPERGVIGSLKPSRYTAHRVCTLQTPPANARHASLTQADPVNAKPSTFRCLSFAPSHPTQMIPKPRHLTPMLISSSSRPRKQHRRHVQRNHPLLLPHNLRLHHPMVLLFPHLLKQHSRSRVHRLPRNRPFTPH